MSFLMPKMPSPPALVQPDVKDVPNYEDEDRKKAEREALEASERKRRGRRSTILTTGKGLTTEAETYQKSLLGG